MYWSRRWQAVRRRVLDRDGWRCRECGSYGNECDHIQPVNAGGAPWSLDNLQTLCRTCHSRKTARENPHRNRRVPGPRERAWREAVKELQD